MVRGGRPDAGRGDVRSGVCEWVRSRFRGSPTRVRCVGGLRGVREGRKREIKIF